MDYKEQLFEYIDAHAEEMVRDTVTLCKINSEPGPAREGMPFGEGPYNALKKAMEICEGYGFSVKSYDNYVMTADLNCGARHLDILAHLDVVAAGDGWTVTEPYVPLVKDGRIYGRGSSDDKGPAMAALYAMRAVKELGIPVKKNCRLILGTDEECGSSDIAHYYALEPEAEMTFSPDAEFPLVNVEKGQFRLSVSAEAKPGDGACVKELCGGTTINIVPGKAYAVLGGLAAEDVRERAAAYEAETGVSLSLSVEDGMLRIDAEGKGAHASTPQEGKNAATALLGFVAALPLSDSMQTELLRKLSELFPFGDYYGAALGINLEDEISGPTTVSLDLLKLDENGIFAKFDSRTCVAANEENTVQKARKKAEEAGFSVKTEVNGAHVVDADSPFIKTLLCCYEAATGEPGRTACMGGGTYVHHLERGVAFGAVGEFTDTHMHGANEFMEIEELKTAAKIFALSIAELCK